MSIPIEHTALMQFAVFYIILRNTFRNRQEVRARHKISEDAFAVITAPNPMTYFLHKIQVGEGGKRFAKVLDTARDWKE